VQLLLPPHFILTRRRVLASLLFGHLLAISALGSQDTLIRRGDNWRYQLRGVADLTTWSESCHPVSNWPSGPTPIGANYPVVATSVSVQNPDNGERRITTLFRRTLQLADPDHFAAYQLIVHLDDGAQIMVNNREVLRANLPEGRITPATRALVTVKSQGEGSKHLAFIHPEVFVAGENTIAVAVHQSNISSSDIYFDCTLIGLKDAGYLHRSLSDNQEAVVGERIEQLSSEYALRSERNRVDFYYTIIRAQWGGVVLLLLTAGLIIYTLRRQINRQQQQETRLVDDRERVAEQLQEKSQEVISLSIQNIRNGNFNQEIKLELLQLAAQHSGIKANLQKTVNKIDKQFNSEADWDKMKLHFNAVYSGFFDRLSADFPTLSPQEIRHCSFIKLHLDTKEISQILRIDPRSVQASRYRIKKKLQLPESEDLRTFIINY